MPQLKRKLLFFFISIFAILILTPKTIFATPLTWQNTYPYSGKSGFIKFSSAVSSTVYVAVDNGSTYDLLKSSDSGQTWTSIKGDLPVGSDITWISDYPLDSDVLAISLWGQGMFLTEDGGTTWKKIFDSGSPKSIEINPTDLDIIYAGFFQGLGLQKTINKGASWEKINASDSTNVGLVKIDPNNNSVVYLSQEPNFYKSTDAGSSWIKLSIDNVFGDRIIIDSLNMFLGRSGGNAGIYKSIYDSDSWRWLETGPTGYIYQLAQDQDKSLFATRVFSNPNGGVWKSSDAGDTWENVQDPSWGDSSTWGLDAKGGVVVVNVSGKGIFVATNSAVPLPTPTLSPIPTPSPLPSPTPVTGPNPVVVIPGFGGSYSTKGLILHQDTNYRDWQMMPFQAPAIYNPFINALQKLNYLRTNKIFFFAYDFTKTIAVSGSWLNEYLTNEVLTKNPGSKVDIVSHSMGGLVARYCFEKIDGCKDKINKVVTAGTPHKGAVADYAFWEGGDVSSLDPLGRFGTELYLSVNGGGHKVQTIQLTMPGAKDFMPVHDYIVDKPYAVLSNVGKNPVLENLPLSNSLSLKAFALSGNKAKNTDAELTVKQAKPKDMSNGIWIDGVPKVSRKDTGDGTVLAMSSQITGAINKSYNLKHIDYLTDKKATADIMQFLGLSPIGLLPVAEPNTVAVYFSTDPNVDINVTKESGEEIVKPDKNVVFVKGGNAKKRNILLKSNKDSDVDVNGFYYDDNSGLTKNLKPFKTILLKNVLKNVSSQFN